MKPILLIILALVYAVWPYDLLFDLLPGWGWLDDAALLYMAWVLYRRMRRPAGGSGGSQETTGRRRPEAKDPFEVLGISREASPEEITRAYRSLAARYHPDKVQHLGEDFQKLAEERFKQIQNAYEALKQQGRVHR